MSSSEYDVRLSERAQVDIEKIEEYIATNNPLNAERFVNQLLAAIGTLKQLPTRHPRALESRLVDYPVYQMVFGSYRVVYRVVNQTVEVITVRHAARRPAREL